MGGAFGRATTLAAAVCLVLAGCTGVSVPGAPRTPATVRAGWPGCEAVGAFVDDRGQGPPGQGGVPAGFEPTRVVLCQTDERDVGGATTSVDLERTSNDVAPMLSYLDQPDGAPTQAACTADAWIAPWLFLLDAQGRFLAPAIPVDGCDKPLGWSSRSHQALTWDALRYSDRVLGPAQDFAGQLGCPRTQTSPVAALATSTRRREGAFGADPFGGRPVRLCVYDEPPGAFVTGQTLLPDERTAFVTALTRSAPAPSRCSRTSAQLGVVGPREGGPRVYVELGGCRRVVTDTGRTPAVRADDELLRLLGG